MANTTLPFSLLSTTRIKVGFQLVFTSDGVGVEVRVDCSQPAGGGGVHPYITYTGMCRQTGLFQFTNFLERSIKNWRISRSVLGRILERQRTRVLLATEERKNYLTRK